MSISRKTIIVHSRHKASLVEKRVGTIESWVSCMSNAFDIKFVNELHADVVLPGYCNAVAVIAEEHEFYPFTDGIEDLIKRLKEARRSFKNAFSIIQCENDAAINTLDTFMNTVPFGQLPRLLYARTSQDTAKMLLILSECFAKSRFEHSNVMNTEIHRWAHSKAVKIGALKCLKLSDLETDMLVERFTSISDIAVTETEELLGRTALSKISSDHVYSFFRGSSTDEPSGISPPLHEEGTALDSLAQVYSPQVPSKIPKVNYRNDDYEGDVGGGRLSNKIRELHDRYHLHEQSSINDSVAKGDSPMQHQHNQSRSLTQSTLHDIQLSHYRPPPPSIDIRSILKRIRQ